MNVCFEDLPSLVGREIGRSSARVVDQQTIDRFAEVTGDRNWIHVDPARAAASPYGSTIAHGYLTLSFAAAVLTELLTVEGARFSINYGLNRVRFPAPLRSGSVITGRAVVLEVNRMADCAEVVARVEIRSSTTTKPVCVAESVLRFYPDDVDDSQGERSFAAYH
jgi:acyl dehydratase